MPINQLLADPHFLLLDFDFEEEWMVFASAASEDYEQRLRLSALDFPLDRLIAVPIDRVQRTVVALAGPPRTNFLFHLPFSGSTFLTRHLECEVVHLLRDPACLDAVFRSAAEPRDLHFPVSDLRRTTLALLNRHVPGRMTVVRTAGYYPEMFGPLGASPTCRSILFLYCEPDVFLLQVLKSGERCRDLRLLMAAEQRLVQWTGRDLALLSDAEVAALFWVFASTRALATFGGKIGTVDSDDLFGRPEEVAALAAMWFGIDPHRLRHDTHEIGTTHAKDGRPFDRSLRATQLEELRSRHMEELGSARPLLEALGATDLVRRLRRRGIRCPVTLTVA